MRYPAALSYTPARSRWYACLALLITIILIAFVAINTGASGLFSLKNSLLSAAVAAVSIWLLHDAWRQPRGQLHYSQGQWRWQREGGEIAGTLRLHLDLQNYLLVSLHTQHGNNSFLSKTTQWFHLEARQVDQAAGHVAWAQLRRAVFAQVEPSHEAVVI
jgi:hypothetical protein